MSCTLENAVTQTVGLTEERNLRLTLQAEPISGVEEFKFLGVTFNSRLTWKVRIQNLTRSLNRSANLMYLLSPSKICLGLKQLTSI